MLFRSAFLGEKLPDWKAAASLVRKIAENYKLPYYTMSPTYSICSEHGYLTGEQYTCPICGKETEVYSRITGYYRPVKNWNDGKSQEFKERKVYDIPHSKLRRKAAGADIFAEAAAEVACETKDATLRLFATKTCPNCKLAAQMLTKANVAFEKVDAEENAALATELGIKQAPTLVVQDGRTTKKITGASDIKKFIEAM